MTREQPSPTEVRPHDEALPPSNLLALTVRGTTGGVFMGLANLVPGISGGTMLLAIGVYPRFVRAVAEVTTLRFRLPSLVLLGTIVTAAGLAIALLAGPVKELVVDHRWVMYSLFIGLTLGGLPIVWRLASPVSRGVHVGATVGFGLMLGTLFFDPGSTHGGEQDYLMLFIAGAAGASAMVLPGVSGGYLLLVLGQYVPVLASISRTKDAVAARDFTATAAELYVLGPFALGVLIGIVVVSNAIRWLLERYEKRTLGVLMGLLVGAVVGLWPFQQGVMPRPGDVVQGQVMTAERIAELDAEHYPTQFFRPSPAQIAGSFGLLLTGFGLTVLIARFGREGVERFER